MAQVKSTGFNNPKMMAGDGRAAYLIDKATLSANPSINDTMDFLLPAGFELARLKFIVPDMDSGAGLAAKIGYAPVAASSSLVANDTYFKAAGAFGQAAGGVECDFAPVRFDEDVYVRITFTAVAIGFSAGTTTAVMSGNMVGVK